MNLTAEDVKAALRKRHPAYDLGLQGVGRWVCIEEWEGIDLLALDAWQSASVVGYEVKVSRSDMRTELLKPSKRAAAVAMCTEFYFAVPAGLLTSEELAWEEPEWTPDDFKRPRCEGITRFGPEMGWAKKPRYGGRCEKKLGTRQTKYMPAYERTKYPRGFLVEVPVPVTLEPTDVSHYPEANRQHISDQHLKIQLGEHGKRWVKCPTCQGKGCSELSRVERESPTLWVPRDVGLVSVGPNGCSVIRPAPKHKITEPLVREVKVRRGGRDVEIDEETTNRLARQQMHTLVRWVSARPDPRHTERGNNRSIF